MGFSYLLALLAIVATPFLQGRFRASSVEFLSNGFVKLLSLMLLCLSFAVELLIMEQRQFVHTIVPLLSPVALANCFGLLAIAQTILLGTVYYAFRNSEAWFDRFAVVLSSMSMAAFALSFQNSSGDLTAYVASGMVANPYLPTDPKFLGDFSRLNDLWGTPVMPAPYGFLWQDITRVANMTSATLVGRIHAFQLLGALMLGITTAVFAIRKVPLNVWALVCCNPFFLRDYVAEGHNDITGTTFILLATIAATPLAVILVAAAGSIKISLAFVGLSVFAKLTSTYARLSAAALSLGLTGLIVLLSGHQFIAAMQNVMRLYAQPIPADVNMLHILLIGVMCLSIATSLFFGKINPSAAWGCIALGQYPLENYLIWGLPIACVSETLPIFLVLTPFAQFEITNIIKQTALQSTCSILCFMAIVVVALNPILQKGTFKTCALRLRMSLARPK